MSKIMNKTSYFLLMIVLAVSGAFIYTKAGKVTDPLMATIFGIIIMYLSVILIYYCSRILLKWINHKPVKKETELLNMILIVSIIGLALFFSQYLIKWNLQLMTIISDLVTALGYFYFAEKIEKTTPKVAALYSLSFVVFQTLLTLI